MRRASVLIALLLGVLVSLPAVAQQIRGSGSTFAFPVLAKWADAYEKVSGVRVAYQPIGSAGGIIEISADIVDFGVTDAPLVDAQLLRDGLIQFPLVIGAIVPVVNLDGVAPGQLHFTGQLLADIYLGKVKAWSDPAIAAINPGVSLPDRAILVVYRSDGSGTTFNWSDFLSKVSGLWKAKIGASTTVAWPTGVGGKGNGGVAEKIARVKGSIGYVEYSYATHNKLVYGLVRNRSDAFVSPNMASFQAATEGVDWTAEPDFHILLTDADGPGAYPIMATSFVLIRKYPKQVDRSRDMLAFFRWALEHGQGQALSLDYLPLPPSLVRLVEAYWQAEPH
ncbi:MAG: phosphate ABC transporter substrate-binding protein PstS [Rhodopila sp.]|nr:phosphate ABC transporter substrate-binding protein PstS [Rhodopila sp.]